MNLMYRYTSKPDLLIKMAQLAREELLHFQQLVKILVQREIEYIRLSPSRYAAALFSHVSAGGNERLVDILIIGAFIEARSCERFACLAPLLDAELQRHYRGLLKSEARHFEDYLQLARNTSEGDIDARIASFAAIEVELILSPDPLFRFHSGIPT